MEWVSFAGYNQRIYEDWLSHEDTHRETNWFVREPQKEKKIRKKSRYHIILHLLLTFKHYSLRKALFKKLLVCVQKKSLAPCETRFVVLFANWPRWNCVIFLHLSLIIFARGGGGELEAQRWPLNQTMHREKDTLYRSLNLLEVKESLSPLTLHGW